MQPTPLGGGFNCNGQRAVTAHTGGIVVAMGDGSVRIVSPSVNPNTWWYAFTPNGGEILTNW
jgi:prepilin-type processing-associated H-X9-DG protein